MGMYNDPEYFEKRAISSPRNKEDRKPVSFDFSRKIGGFDETYPLDTRYYRSLGMLFASLNFISFYF